MIIRIKKKNGIIICSILALLLVCGMCLIHGLSKKVCLPIIMYHSIGENAGTYVLPQKQLEEDLRYLKERGYITVTVQDLILYASGNGTLPDKPVMLTFDDGYMDNYAPLMQLLPKYNMKAVLSVVGQSTDGAGEHNDNGSLTWAQLYALIKTGRVELQNHSYAMHSNTEGRRGSMINPGESVADYAKAFIKDTVRMQRCTAEILGVEMTAYTYPYGYVGKYSEKLLKELGFKATLSCREGINKITKNPNCLYLLKRNNRPAGESSEAYFTKIGAR